MAINRDVIGKSYGPFGFEYGHRDTILYALGIGANESELPFLYEKHGPLVYPSYAVVPAFTAAGACVGELKINPFMIVHGEQHVRLHGPVPPRGKIETVSTVKGIYDKGSGALVEVECRSSAEGKALFENVFSFFVRGEGGFGGDRGPKTEKAEPPARPPDLRAELVTERRQALLFRLSGDWNPLHADPDVAKAAGFERPILHGLCTFGHTVRAVVRDVCGCDPAKVRGIHARFSAPVLPGQTLIVEMWRDGSRVLCQTKTDAGSVVLSNGLIELA